MIIKFKSKSLILRKNRIVDTIFYCDSMKYIPVDSDSKTTLEGWWFKKHHYRIIWCERVQNLFCQKSQEQQRKLFLVWDWWAMLIWLIPSLFTKSWYDRELFSHACIFYCYRYCFQNIISTHNDFVKSIFKWQK